MTVTTKKAKKPPTQIAGVSGIDGHGGMGEATKPAHINWASLSRLPAFEMFVYDQSGQQVGSAAKDWIAARRASLGDSVLYEQYAEWHNKKGLWVGESPTGEILAKE